MSSSFICLMLNVLVACGLNISKFTSYVTVNSIGSMWLLHIFTNKQYYVCNCDHLLS